MTRSATAGPRWCRYALPRKRPTPGRLTEKAYAARPAHPARRRSSRTAAVASAVPLHPFPGRVEAGARATGLERGGVPHSITSSAAWAEGSSVRVRRRRRGEILLEPLAPHLRPVLRRRGRGFEHRASAREVDLA